MTSTSITQRDTKNTVRLLIWTLAWVGTLALAQFGPALWGDQPAISWVAIIVNLAAGLGWIIAHARFLRESDDLQRKIMLDAIAAALGAGLVGGFAYTAATNAKIVPDLTDIALMSVVMAVVYVVGIIVGRLRYR